MDVSTFTDDLLDLGDFAQRLESFIRVERHFVHGSLVICLNARYGSGKTTFLRMWKNDIEGRGNGTNKPLIVSLNAWESDYYGDPLFAITSSLIASLGIENPSSQPLQEAAKDIGWVLTAIGGQVAKHATGIDFVEAGALAERKKTERENRDLTFLDSFSMYQRQKQAMKHLRTALEKCVSSTDGNLLFLVDELDRCRPDYAISYLETIKHIFDIPGLVFIIAADRTQLQNSAKTAFGADLDFDEYLRKFIHRETSLPPISISNYDRLARKYVEHYLERTDLRFCYMKIDSAVVDRSIELLSALKLTPRQIQEVFRLLGHTLATTEENQGKLMWCLGVGTLLMAALRVGNPRLFSLAGTQQLQPEEGYQFLKDLLKEEAAIWWFAIILSGGGIKMNSEQRQEDVLNNLKVNWKGTYPWANEMLGQMYLGWGAADKSRLIEIHQKIQEIGKWQ